MLDGERWYAAAVGALAPPRLPLASEPVDELATELDRPTVAGGMGDTAELCDIPRRWRCTCKLSREDRVKCPPTSIVPATSLPFAPPDDGAVPSCGAGDPPKDDDARGETETG